MNLKHIVLGGILLFVGIGSFISLRPKPKNILVVPYGGYEGESFFELQNANPLLVRDNSRVPYHMLKESLTKLGYTVKCVRDAKEFDDAAAVICFDVPLEYPDIMAKLPRLRPEKLLLFLGEPPTIKPYNYLLKFHEPFGTVFTMFDSVIDNVRYHKFYEPQPTFDMVYPLIPFEQRKLCTLLGGNKTSLYQFQLYSERRKVIDFFEKVKDADFDLYGPGWEQEQLKNYKGFVQSKAEALNHYKFCICYENMHSVDGYVTGEKLFYCLISGCIPVYLGAPNITNYIPKNCFIDRRDFKNEKELYTFMKNMTKEQYLTYLENIKQYLKSAQAHKFSSENFVHIVISKINPNYDKNKIFTSTQITMLDAIYGKGAA